MDYFELGEGCVLNNMKKKDVDFYSKAVSLISKFQGPVDTLKKEIRKEGEERERPA